MGWVSSFTNIGNNYLFGCEKGLAITDHEYSLLNSFKSKKEVQDLIIVDDSHVLLAEYTGFIEVVNTQELKQVATKQFTGYDNLLTLYKTKVAHEFAICTSQGLYFFMLQRHKGKFKVAEPHESYYSSFLKKESIKAMVELEQTQIAVAFRQKSYIEIIDRHAKMFKKMKQINIPDFNPWLWTMRDLKYDDGRQMLFIKDEKHIF